MEPLRGRCDREPREDALSSPTLETTDPRGSPSLAEFLAKRNKALVELDESYVAATVPKAPPEMRLVILHKSRYECTAIAPELRHASRKWLDDRGFKRMTGTPLLPEGVLPL